MVCTFLDHEKFDLSVLIAGHNDRADFHCSLPLTVIRTARVDRFDRYRFSDKYTMGFSTRCSFLVRLVDGFPVSTIYSIRRIIICSRLFGYYFRAWSRVGRDPQKQPVFRGSPAQLSRSKSRILAMPTTQNENTHANFIHWPAIGDSAIDPARCH